ncbi:hypothetical protein V1502_12610 [Bacillus sp. SCS-153A]|uniref:hypothetical protein n=1 Tax=Rossellomorea sedimentorum TaxID=3115294 RepID=UPI0039064B52
MIRRAANVPKGRGACNVSIVAIITLVGLKWEATPLQMSLIILSLALPMALLGPVSGAAGRMERKTLMMVSDIVRGILILLLTLAVMFGWSMPAFSPEVFFFGFCSS